MEKRRSCRKSGDFLRYDDSDVDLADIFGDDYTEFEEDLEESEWEEDNTFENEKIAVDEKITDENSSEDERENTPVPAKRRNTKKTKDKAVKRTVKGKNVNIYKCTECGKELKTISGLRGHMSSKHAIDKPIKAAEYRIDGQPKLITNVRPLTEEEDFKLVFPGISEAAVMFIAEKSTFVKGRTPMARNIVACSKKLDVKKLSGEAWQMFHALLKNLDRGVSPGLSRELMFSDFVKMREDQTFLDSLVKCGIEELPNHKQFVQVLIKQILEHCLVETTLLAEKEMEKDADLTQIDQDILYYIAGYFIRTLMKSSIQGSDEIIREGKVTPDTSSTFKDDYSGWTSKTSRGGLIMASDNMFLFVRSIENVMRKNVNIKSLSQTSLLSTPLREAIMEDFLVAHYWAKLASNVTAKSSCQILERLVSLFQRVRGNAVAKCVRRGMQKDAGNKKKQKSLRKELKDKSNASK